MTSLDRLPAAALASAPGDPAVVERIRSGATFSFVVAVNPAQLTARVEAVLDSVADLDTRIVRVGNPLRAPLSIERILIQVAGPAADCRLEREPALLTAVLAGPVGDESKLLVVVEQPQTIDPESLQVLRAMAPHCAQSRPAVQFLFAGPPAFADAMAAAEPAPAPAMVASLEPVTSHPVAAESVTVATRPRRLRLVTVAGVAVACVVGLAVPFRSLLPRSSSVPEPAPAAAAASVPVAAAADVSVARPAPEPVAPVAPAPAPAAAAEPDSEARLRGEFDLFLARAGGPVSGLPQQQRAELFQEFLAWRRGRGSADHDKPAQPGGQDRQQVR